MPWCPKCRNEYREGFTICPDCNIQLVDELQEEEEYVLLYQTEEEEILKKITEYLDESNVTYKTDKKKALLYDSDEKVDVYEINVPKKALKEAQKALLSIAAEYESENGEEEIYHGSTVYVDSKTKSSDYRSSGVMFIIMAILMITFALFDHFAGKNFFNNLSCIVIIAFSVCSLIIGIGSLIHSASMKKDIVEEENSDNEVKEYLSLNFSKEVLDKLTGEELPEELAYLNRYEKMKESVKLNFDKMDEDHIDSLIEDYYNSIYND